MIPRLLLCLFALLALPAYATTFTPLVKGFSWTPATSGTTGPLAAAETTSGFTIGIRLDGDTTHAVANYQYLADVPATQTTETPAQLTAALGKALPPGNYWMAVDQTDTLNGATTVSGWSSEVPFSVAAVIVQPLSPTNATAN